MSDFSKISLDSTPYQGLDQMTIGDGSSLTIQNCSSGLLLTPFGNFLLCQLLHIPLISQNLLFVFQFHLDNFVFFEFNSSIFCEGFTFLGGIFRAPLGMACMFFRLMIRSSLLPLGMHLLVKEPHHTSGIPVSVTPLHVPLPSPCGNTTSLSLLPLSRLLARHISNPNHTLSLIHPHISALIFLFRCLGSCACAVL